MGQNIKVNPKYKMNPKIDISIHSCPIQPKFSIFFIFSNFTPKMSQSIGHYLPPELIYEFIKFLPLKCAAGRSAVILHQLHPGEPFQCFCVKEISKKVKLGILISYSFIIILRHRLFGQRMDGPKMKTLWTMFKITN